MPRAFRNSATSNVLIVIVFAGFLGACGRDYSKVVGVPQLLPPVGSDPDARSIQNALLAPGGDYSLITVRKRPDIAANDPREILCAAPSPDWATALAMAQQISGSGGVSGGPSGALTASSSLTETISALAGRTAGVVALRDGLYNACQAYANGVIGKDGYALILSQCGNLQVALAGSGTSSDGGFGGFLDRQFREHDFKLGRRNCQEFLRTWTESAFTKGRTPVIPLFGSAARDIPLPDWPCMTRKTFESLEDKIKLRADAVVSALLKQEVKVPGRWLAASLLHWLGVKNQLLRTVHGLILADLIRRDQIEDGLRDDDQTNPRLRDFTPDERKVIAAMASSGYDLRTVAGIRATTGLDVTTSLNATTNKADELIRRTIDRAKALPDHALHRVWESPLKVRLDDVTPTSRRIWTIRDFLHRSIGKARALRGGAPDTNEQATYTLLSRRLPDFRTAV